MVHRYLTNKQPELQLIERAIRGNWPMSEQQRGETIDTVMKLLRSDNESVAVKAARVLQLMARDDRQFELGIRAMVAQAEARRGVLYDYDTEEDPAAREILEAQPEDIHRYLEAEADANDAEEAE